MATFFTKPPRKHDRQPQWKKKVKKLADDQSKLEPKKMMHRKSNRATQSNHGLDTPIPTVKDDTPAQAKLAAQKR